MAPLDTLRAAYADPYAAARAHRAAGGKVVGYFLNSVPEELIVAAGCFPVRLRGEPSQRSAIADRYMEEYMDGEVRAIFGALLEGRFDFIDLLVIPRNSEVYLQLYYFLQEIPQWEPDARLPPMVLFDLLQTPSSTTLRYVEGRLRALAATLEHVGRPITATNLAAAIVESNARRSLLKHSSVLWQGPRPALTGADALAVIACNALLPHDHYVATLQSLLASPPKPLDPRPRILLKGSPQSDARFTALIEGAGAAVVAHDHLWGDRTYATLVRERCDPWQALAQHYALDIPSPREYPQAKADARFLELVSDAGVDGVVFFHDEWDDTLGWEYPDQKRLLENRRIPSLFLKRQPFFDPDMTQQSSAVRSFIESLRVDA